VAGILDVYRERGRATMKALLKGDSSRTVHVVFRKEERKTKF
jgi:hypothetical protein